MNVIKLLEIEEGYREKAYYCSEGYPTIGIGKRIGDKSVDLKLYEFTVSKSVAMEWIKCDVDELIIDINKRFKWFGKLNEARAAIVVSMCYQLGINGFSKFKQTIYHIQHGNYSLASVEMLDSRWAKQTPQRAERHSRVMLTGSFDNVYED